MLLPSPVYPQRFMRMPGISAAKSMGVFNELKNNGCLNPKNFLKVAPNDIVALVVANPQNWPILLSLSLAQRDFVSDEVEVMWAAHHFHTDFAAKDLRFINQACATSVSTSVPKNNELVKIFPNPTSQNIQVPEYSEAVRIFDLGGNIVLEKTLASESALDVSALTNGLYFLEIQVNGQRQVAKLIKQ